MALVVLAAAGGSGGPSVAAPAQLKLVQHTTAIAYQKQHTDQDLQAWRKRVPATELVRIPSSLDGKQQRAIWYHSDSPAPKPLLVVLHSWSADFEQNLDIPFAELAIANDWAFIHPDFRGPNRRPEATASDLTVQDIVDAVKFAQQKAKIDPARIYMVGYSGGAMQALVMAGRHPELWAGIVAWGTIHDIGDWYRHKHTDARDYRKQIAASCGGVPRPGTDAERECRERSPSTQLAMAAGKVPILIAHGLSDRTVPPHHAVDAFNTLAGDGQRFTEEERASIDGHGKLPAELAEQGPPRDKELTRAFEQATLPVRFERRSRGVTLLLFEGQHDMAYNPTVVWLNRQRRR